MPWKISYYCFCSHIQSLVELESVIVPTTSYFEHTASLTYSLCSKSIYKLLNIVGSFIHEGLKTCTKPRVKATFPAILSLDTCSFYILTFFKVYWTRLVTFAFWDMDFPGPDFREKRNSQFSHIFSHKKNWHTKKTEEKIHLTLCDFAKVVFWSILSFKSWNWDYF